MDASLSAISDDARKEISKITLLTAEATHAKEGKSTDSKLPAPHRSKRAQQEGGICHPSGLPVLP